MPSLLNIEEFLIQSRNHPVIDVRTPAEFQHGHIPGAFNLPLFTDEERALVGTAYKQEGKEPAMLLGLELVGPRMRSMVEMVRENFHDTTLLVHCWRGGMRSGSVSWLLEFFGYRVSTLSGGYKSFRRFALEQFSVERSLRILGGMTGSGKTRVLHQMREAGEQVVDLENIAHHKGSSFGALGEISQPTQEQFENDLALALASCDPDRSVWLEDESQKIGISYIPAPLFEQMRRAPLFYMEIPVERRIQNLVKDYGEFPREALEAAILRLKKRLGGLDTKTALEALEAGDTATTVRILLQYYDKTYSHGLSLRDPSSVQRVELADAGPSHIAQRILARA